MTNYEGMLSYGAIRDIVEQTEVPEPVLQVLAYKDVTTDGAKRFRFMLSDGQFTHQCCILMGEQVRAVENGQLERYTIIRLKKYVCNLISDKRVIIMLEPEVIASGSSVGRKIGNPIQYNGPSTKAPPIPEAASRSVGNVGASSSSSDSSKPWTSKPFGNVQSDNVMSGDRFNGEKRKKIEGGYIAIKPSGSSSNTLNPALSVPISTLTAYHNKWLIKGRVTSKSTIRRWSNAKGEGKLFSFDVMDESGTIRVTCFKAEVDKFYETFKIGDVIMVSRGMIKEANKKFATNNHAYEISLGSDSVLEVMNDDNACPKIEYNFVRIADLESQPAESIVDVAGIICSASDLQTFNQKNTNRELKKRDLQIVDQSSAQIRVTIWGQEAVDFEFQEGTVLVGRALKVSDYAGRSLGSANGSAIQYDPQIDLVFTLKGWFDRSPEAANARNLSAGGQGGEFGSRMTGAFVPLEQLTDTAVSEGLTNVTVDATIVQTGKPNAYKSCPECNRKVQEVNSLYHCTKCERDMNEFKFRVILKAMVADHTGNTWITLFHQDVERLLNINFNESGLCNPEREDEFLSVIGTLNHRRYTMALRCRIENYNERNRINTACNALTQYDPIEHGKRLLATMKAN
jgi:replication factor A1